MGLQVSLWCAGIAAFGLLYAPQGLLTDIAADYAITAAQASLLVSAATLGLALSIIPWALLSDRIGRAQAMRIAAVGAAALAIATPLMPGLDAMIGSRFLQGVALGGIPALAMSYLHERAQPGRAVALAGSYVAATSIGGLSGRLVAVPLAATTGWRASLLIVGMAGALITIVLALLLRSGPTSGMSTRESLRTLRTQLSNPDVLPLYAIGALLIGCMVAVYNTLAFRLEAPPYGLSATTVSIVFLAYLGGTVSSRLSGRLITRWGERPTLLVSCGLMLLGTAATLAQELPVLLSGVVILTTGMFLGHSTANALVASRSLHARTHATALYSVSYYAGASMFGALGGVAWVLDGWVLVTILVVILSGTAAALALIPYRKDSAVATD